MGQAGTAIEFKVGYTSRLIVDALRERGYEITYDRAVIRRKGKAVSRKIARFSVDGVGFIVRGAQIYFSNNDGSVGKAVDGRAIRLFKQKDMVKSLLRLGGYSVPEGMTFCKDEEGLAKLYFSHALSMFPAGVCVKPVDGNMGRDVFVGVKVMAEFEAAFRSVADQYGRVMVEEVVRGGVYRFTTILDSVVAVRVGRPQNVVGDGHSSIEELVQKKIAKRSSHPVYRIQPFPFGDEQIEFLRLQGLDRADRVAPGEVVYIGSRSNSHAGADVVECMDTMHPSYIRLVAEAVYSLPDIVVCGADVMIVDPAQPANRDNYSIIELNTGPGFVASSFPWEGEQRDIAGALIDALVKIANNQVGGRVVLP